MEISECHNCSDTFEEEAICYVCYQQMRATIHRLTTQITELLAERDKK